MAEQKRHESKGSCPKCGGVALVHFTPETPVIVRYIYLSCPCGFEGKF